MLQASGSHLLAIAILQGLAAGTLLYVTFYEVGINIIKITMGIIIFVVVTIVPIIISSVGKLLKISSHININVAGAGFRQVEEVWDGRTRRGSWYQILIIQTA